MPLILKDISMTAILDADPYSQIPTEGMPIEILMSIRDRIEYVEPADRTV